MDLGAYIKEQAKQVEERLNQLLPDAAVMPDVIHRAMRYSCLGGGKRLRAILAVEACRAVGGDGSQALDFACAVEMIHAYSLVHDDLPAMDNDDYRRGKLANHKVFGEGIAILAGDALLTYAFETLSRMALDSGLVVRLIQEVAAACGSQGLVGGQAVDLQSEGHEVDELTLEYIHRHKTGKLFLAALRGGALIGGANDEELSAITLYGENLGLAFQITDDILDVAGDMAKLGKVTGADARQGKTTYVTLLGLEDAQKKAVKCVEQCIRYARRLPSQNYLAELAEYVQNRES
ncbi:MAG: polyprenyl synthetase family protein [Limnochordia bacterium]|jgi:geranylgeranyl diphosphate synthase type II|nr:polyprenyl synthetase family protein [Bacillota bacterium]HOB08087.1 polyprenyl synthetase family protein [Limnochordia bacterium]NLH32282.1 polyprenyl synthetase family protein [Bacillota bacterium]HPT92440.1 polyprenyl synthetase family protein [Limnochordia bacterium]HPZ30218.1 polyprenyl synthetase family protein [Limnochordia bacterium]